MASGDFDLCLTAHAKDQMLSRDLFTPDIKHVLKTGFVYEEPEEATRVGHYKYRMDGRSPNSGNRTVRVVVIPDLKTNGLKIVTVMWVDEANIRS